MLCHPVVWLLYSLNHFGYCLYGYMQSGNHVVFCLWSERADVNGTLADSGSVFSGVQACCVAVFSFCGEIRLSSARCLSLSVSTLLLLHLSPLLSQWWVLVCCFSDAALTSDCSLFITSVYASPFLPFPLYSSAGQPVSQIPVVRLVKHRYYTL